MLLEKNGWIAIETKQFDRRKSSAEMVKIIRDNNAVLL